jgi:hypothetical protein
MGIGSLFKQSYNIDREIKLLHDELATIESMSQMLNTQGWVDFSGWIEARIGDVRNDIDGLLSNATKNGKEIERKYWTCEVYQGLLDSVETTLNTKQDKMSELKHLMETAKNLELANAR